RLGGGAWPVHVSKSCSFRWSLAAALHRLNRRRRTPVPKEQCSRGTPACRKGALAEAAAPEVRRAALVVRAPRVGRADRGARRAHRVGGAAVAARAARGPEGPVEPARSARSTRGAAGPSA